MKRIILTALFVALFAPPAIAATSHSKKSTSTVRSNGTFKKTVHVKPSVDKNGHARRGHFAKE